MKTPEKEDQEARERARRHKFENVRIHDGRIFQVGGGAAGWELRARADSQGARICIIGDKPCVDLSPEAACALAHWILANCK